MAESKRSQPHPEDDEDEGLPENSFLALAVDWGQNIGMHGLPNITKSSSKCKKLIWTVLLLAGLSFSVSGASGAAASSDPAAPAAMVAPVVTAASAAAAASAYSASTAAASTSKPATGTPTKPQTSPLPSVPPGRRKKRAAGASSPYSGLTSTMYSSTTTRNLSTMGYSKIPDSVGMNYMFLDFYNSLSDSVKADIGYQLDELLIECSLGSGYCSAANFTRFLHPMYGNCYTFNAAVDNATRVTVTQQGPLFGLTLTLYINQEEYIGTIAQSAGIIVVVHEPNVQPFPEETGVRIPPGTETYLGLKQIHKQLLGSPYADNCAVDFENANSLFNMYRSAGNWSLPNVNYTKMVCLKTCIQRRTESMCNCSSPKLPPSNASLSPAMPVCAYQYDGTTGWISEAAKCMQKTELTEFASCRSSCNSECDEVKYETSTSMAAWPSVTYQDDALKQVTMYSQSIRDKVNSDSANKLVFLMKNFVKLIVYFADPETQSAVSTEGYALTDLLSDMGGQVGLWLGLSVLTLFEILELMFDFAALAVIKTTQQSQLKDALKPTEAKNRSEKLAAIVCGSDSQPGNMLWVDEKKSLNN